MNFENRDFTLLVKGTREKFAVSIDDAHNLIFADPEMRRLVAWRVNHNAECRMPNAECRKQALWDVQHKGAHSRFVNEGGRIRFREPLATR